MATRLGEFLSVEAPEAVKPEKPVVEADAALAKPPEDAGFGVPAVGALVAAARRGDAGAAERLWASQANRLVRAAIALGVPYDEAEDVVQEALLYAFRNFARFDGSRSPFQVWTHRVLLGRASNWHRARRRLAHALALFMKNDLRGQGPGPEETLALEEARQTLRRLAGELSPMQRRVWALTHASDLSIREAAEVLKIREDTVRSHLRYAREALERALRRVL